MPFSWDVLTRDTWHKISEDGSLEMMSVLTAIAVITMYLALIQV
jgi:hypothetical protein